MSDRFPMTIMVSESQFVEAMQAEVDKLVKKAVSEYVSSWSRNTDIKKALDLAWSELIDPLVREEMSNAEALKQEIQKQLKRKLESQLRALINSRNQSEEVDEDTTTS